MARTIGIGKQNFDILISRNCFYVDKTDFIREWWESEDAVTLITRPRRFGKTLNMSMVERFFSLEYAGRGTIFEGLAIWGREKYRRLQGTYPVISLSFANIKERDYHTTRRKICQLIAEEYARNAFLLEGDCLIGQEKDTFRRKTIDMDDVDATLALHQLSLYLSRYYGKNVIILLDEYDTPMQEAYVNGYWEELVFFTRSLFNATFKTNPYLERAIMTGITRISKESIFSDLNNLEVVTTTSEKYQASFGFTQQEVSNALTEYGLSDREEEVKEWYDGFTFGRKRDIYNPWSIINYLDKRELTTYWANTSSNGLVGKLIREGSEDVKVIMEDLMEGRNLHVQIDEQIIFDQLDYDNSAIWSLLLASGYLKVERYELVEGRGEYDLALTNREVRLMFENMIRGWFVKAAPAYNRFVEALLCGDLKAMNAYMNRVAQATFSYFDTGNKPSDYTEPERFYHGFVLGLIVELSDRYVITSNRESGFGRYDVMLEPRQGKGSGNDAIILEFKIRDLEERSLEETAQEALNQIERQNYAAGLEERGFPGEHIRKYGFAFEGKKVLIKG